MINAVRWMIALPFFLIGGALCLVTIIPAIVAWLVFDTGQLIVNKEIVSAGTSVKFTRGGKN